MSPDWRGNRSVSVSMTYPEITQLDQITVNHLNARADPGLSDIGGKILEHSGPDFCTICLKYCVFIVQYVVCMTCPFLEQRRIAFHLR